MAKISHIQLPNGNTLDLGSGFDWIGTKAQYDALETINDDWFYCVTDDNDTTLNILQTIYPIGSLYLTTASTCPLATLGIGTWILEAADRVLQGAGSRGSVGTTVDESLPNIKGSYGNDTTRNDYFSTVSGALYKQAKTTTQYISTVSNTVVSDNTGFYFDASRSSSTYQDNAPVQQDAYLINVFRRIA